MKIKIRKRYLFFILAFSSAIFNAIGSAFDAISQIYIPDPWALGIACFVFGVIVSGLFSIIFSIPYKKKSLGAHTIDPTFKRVRLLKKQEVKYHLIAGFGNAVLTIGYFFLLSLMSGDVSIVLPFTQVVILYLVIIESFSEKDTPSLVEIQSSVIVTFGAILGSLTLSGSINVTALAIVFLVINPGWVLLSVYQRKLKMLKIDESPNDAINIRVWNVIFACMFTIIIVSIFDGIMGTSHVIAGIQAITDQYFWVFLLAITTFFAFVFYIRALGIGKASVTQAVKASLILFSLPVSLILGYYGIIPSFTTDPVMLVIKLMGIVLMLLGILSFALTLTKAYIFIRMKPGYEIQQTMKQLWNIKGVSRVTAVAGPYDFIIKIHTRTLVKGYERIIRKVESIQGIDDYSWQSVLKEWEDI
ncbi:MAG: Lrp/AsnC ligand binding domain-containing protein [Candidatus Thermoplasmatota archaeon]|nr:Lrp/AsnC ligand binding domain-containing protein [Candidatus Thermoplasmatota archaeon]